MSQIRIAAVSYLNSIPLVYGIEHAGLLHAGLLLSPPSRCVDSFVQGRADIALLPVAAFPSVADAAEIVTDYCIGASGPVRTVTVMSNVPIESVRRIYLDSHSRTSVMLTRVLCNELWHITPEYIQMEDYVVAENPREGDAFLFIGDKVFDYEGRFSHVYDLAECWIGMTGLPFVFAAWIARRGTDAAVIELLDNSLKYGVEHITEAIAYYGHSGKPYARDYLTHNIDFVFDERKRAALSLFLEKAGKF